MSDHPVVILAGGLSSRMGFPKVKLAFESKPVISLMYERLEFAGWHRAGIVVSDWSLANWVGKVEPRLEILFNQYPQLGQISSLRLALDWAGEIADGLLAWPVDRPLVAAETLFALGRSASGNCITIPTYQSRRGHPTWWGRGSWSALRSPVADEGANRILAENGLAATEIPVEDKGVIINIDDPVIAAANNLGECV